MIQIACSTVNIGLITYHVTPLKAHCGNDIISPSHAILTETHNGTLFISFKAMLFMKNIITIIWYFTYIIQYASSNIWKFFHFQALQWSPKYICFH